MLLISAYRTLPRRARTPGRADAGLWRHGMVRSNLLRIARTAVVASMLLLGAAACGSAQNTLAVGEPDRGAVGIAMPKESDRWVADGENMVKQFKLLGYEPELKYAGDDVPTQVSQVDDMVKRGDKA